MRSITEARTQWQELKDFKSLNDYKLSIHSQTADHPLISRSIYWKTFLLFESSDHSEWLRRLGHSRSAYASLRNHFLRGLQHSDELDVEADPLSEDSASPWAALRDDETLRAEILQDVDRCMPDNLYFRQPTTQTLMVDILFIYCRLNPDLAYRQGMHELLAPILWAVEQDAIAEAPIEPDELICQLCDCRFVEHDVFTLFTLVMQNAKTFYEQAGHSGPPQPGDKPGKPAGALENPIIRRIQRIYEGYLPHVDPELAAHLKQVDLIPQVFLMKWIRLLFGREFSFDSVLTMWDIIIAEDRTLELVDFVCLVMIIRLHWDLLDSDYNTALTLLLRYPDLPESMRPQDLVEDAMYLRANLSQQAAATVIKRYTGREPQITSEEVPSLSTLSIRPSLSSSRSTHKPWNNFEGVLQEAAKGVYSRGEKWGINRAVRDAVGEVRKGVREIQASQSQTSSPRRQSRTLPRQALANDTNSTRLSALKERNEGLAQMLKKAIDNLWDFQQGVANEKGLDAEDVKALSMAIARVQFVQVYLEDPSIPLAVEDEEPSKNGQPQEDSDGNSKAAYDQSSDAPEPVTSEKPQVEKPSTEDEPSGHQVLPAAQESRQNHLEETIDLPKPTPATRPDDRGVSPEKSDMHTNLSAPRPSLAGSSYSWMLGQDRKPSEFVQVAPDPAEKRRNKGFLFGDEEEDDSATMGGMPGSQKTKGLGARGKRKERGKRASTSAPAHEVFDLGALEESKAEGSKD